MNPDLLNLATALVLATAGPLSLASEASESPAPDAHRNADYLSPAALAVTADEQTLFIACATARQVAVFDVAASQIRRRIDVPESPLGLALSRDGSRLYVACAAPASTVGVIDVADGRMIAGIPAGHTAMAPVLSPDESRLYVCNRFNNDVSVIDVAARKEITRVPVPREPVAAALTPDGQFLLVANHLHTGYLAAVMVSVIDTAAARVTKDIMLPRGSGLSRGIAVSPDGRFAAVTHLLARYYLPTTEVDLGRINANAVSFVDLNRVALLRTLPLDEPTRGAANPWAVTWSADGKTVVVTHAGTHELSLLDAPVLPQKPVRVRQRLALPGNGPRALAAAGTRIYVANYFSDSLCVIDLAATNATARPLALGSPAEPSLARKGEALFNDATLCFQEWQSCASCHDSDARTDGLNWDLLNDGTGNPKNAKSLLWADRTPPAMAAGVRANAEVAVQAGIRHILFTEQPKEVATAIYEYVKSLEPIPSPFLVRGRLSAAAERGQKQFLDEETRCARCHRPPLFTDLKTRNVGTRGRQDKRTNRFDTPTLVELWRTAPYLHDGAAATVRDVLTTRNPNDQHGKTSHLTPQQIDDLAEYLLSL